MKKLSVEMESNESSDEYDSDNEQDSDSELQKAFAEGRLNKGLAYEAVVKPPSINNKAGLKKSLQSLRGTTLPWLERMELTVEPLRPPKVLTAQLGDDPDNLTGDEVHNDYKREMKFYRQAQTAVLEGCPQLQALGIPTRRPNDYLAEMVKSDAHMNKVRQRLLSIKEGQEKSEKAKKLREMKKFGKKVQQEILIQRQQEKKEMMSAVKAYRKGKTKSLDFLEDTPGKKSSANSTAMPQSSKHHGKFQPNKKRQQRNDKFGFGGQKKRSKHNTSESTNDIDKVPRFSTGKKSFGSARAGKNKGNKNRPGKKRRQDMGNRQRQKSGKK